MRAVLTQKGVMPGTGRWGDEWLESSSAGRGLGGAGDSMPQQPRGWGALKAQAASDSPATFMVGAASP